MDPIYEEVLANEEAQEEALWSMHHAAAMTGNHTSTEPDEASSTSGPRSRLGGEYTCDVCGETFFSIVQLAKHRQFHDRDRPYECTICGKRFLSRSHHHEHQRVHTGERPFPCERCDRSFTTHHNLKRHMSIHEKEEMYRCQECGVLFCQEHEYSLEKLRLPAAVPTTGTTQAALPPQPILAMPMPIRLEPFEMEHMIEEDDEPSSSNTMTRIEQILTEKKKKKKLKKKSLLDVSRNIAALPHYSPPEKKYKPEYYEHPVHVYRRRENKKVHSMNRVAYDIEVVL